MSRANVKKSFSSALSKYHVKIYRICNYIFKQHSRESDDGAWSRQEHELDDTNRRHCQRDRGGVVGPRQRYYIQRSV